MNKPQKQTVYLSVNTDEPSLVVQQYQREIVEALVEEQEGYFFTPEKLNEYTANVIRQALETAAEKAKINYKEDGEVTKVKSKKLDIDYLCEVSATVSFNINRETITNTFENTFEKFKA